MNLTLHLTERCNLRCTYCTREKLPRDMSEEVLDAACELAFSAGGRAGLCFFGGEPLLQRPLIERAFANCRKRSEETGIRIDYRMTTNGTLLTEDFLRTAAQEPLIIGLSTEGLAQDICRKYPNGSGTFAELEEKSRLLLKYIPQSYAMMTIAPQAAEKLAESVRYLRGLGFRRINMTIAYGKNVHWTDEALDTVNAQLREAADFYAESFMQGHPFYFSPLDSKISDVIRGYNPADRCHLGMRQMPVAPDGNIYACTQFIGDPEYCLGNVFDGLDKDAQLRLMKKEATPESCRECALRKRCTNACGCLNRLESGDERIVSPLQCTYERMLIALADETAEKLYAQNPEKFAKRFC